MDEFNVFTVTHDSDGNEVAAWFALNQKILFQCPIDSTNVTTARALLAARGLRYVAEPEFYLLLPQFQWKCAERTYFTRSSKHCDKIKLD